MLSAFRYLHDCPECFWAMQEGFRWERACAVPPCVREKTCEKLGLKFQSIKDNYFGSRTFGLGEPAEVSCKAVLAQGGGKCWASSVFYLLTGKKSGKNFQVSCNTL